MDEIDPGASSSDSLCIEDVYTSLTANITLVNFKSDVAKKRILYDFHRS